MRKPEGVSRIFFKQFKPGDLRKLRAESNDSQTGGGARDLRFPYEPFKEVMSKLFPGQGKIVRGCPLFVGELSWEEAGKDKSAAVEVWPPTKARPAEGRIARIHELRPLKDTPDDPKAEVVLLLLIQQDDGQVRAHYVTEQGFKDPRFNKEIRQQVLACVRSTPDTRAAVGYFDYLKGEAYCHHA